MALFVILSKLTDKGAATLFERPERIKEVNKELEAMGVRVLQQYFVLGDYDFINIVEANDEKDLIRAVVNLNMRGTIRTVTYRIIPVEKLIEILKKEDIEPDLKSLKF